MMKERFPQLQAMMPMGKYMVCPLPAHGSSTSDFH